MSEELTSSPTMNAAGVEDLAKEYLVRIHEKLGREYSHQAYIHVMGFVGFVKKWEETTGKWN